MTLGLMYGAALRLRGREARPGDTRNHRPSRGEQLQTLWQSSQNLQDGTALTKLTGDGSGIPGP